MNPKHDLKRLIKGLKNNKEFIGPDYDLFYLIKDLFDYTETLEDRIERLEEKKE